VQIRGKPGFGGDAQSQRIGLSGLKALGQISDLLRRPFSLG